VAAVGAGLAALGWLAAPAAALPGTTDTLPMPVPAAWDTTSVTYTSVACAAIGACTAIGSHDDGSSLNAPTAGAQHASAWAQPTTFSLPPGSRPSPFANLGFSSVVCPTQGDCVAVGTFLGDSTDTNLSPMIAMEAGGVWGAATSSLPVPAGTSWAQLAGIWCASAGTCAVAGQWWQTPNGYSHAFVDQEVAGSWHPSVTLPDPSRRGVTTNNVAPASISCTQLDDCVVVGSFSGPKVSPNAYGFAEVEHAGAWTPSVVVPPGASQSELTSVDCPSAATCVAVGDVHAGYLLAPFAVTDLAGAWRGGRVLPSRYAAPATVGGALLAVSCLAAQQCIAVGQLDGPNAGNTGDDTDEFPVAYTWHAGTWSAPALAAAPASRRSASGGASLSSISCPSTTACEAVGSTTPRASSVNGVYPFSTVVWPSRPAGAPSAPQGLAVLARHRAFRVSWRGPSMLGGAPIAAFRVVAHSPGEPSVSCVTTTLQCTITGVVPTHRYLVGVTAENVGQRSGPTARRSVVGR
jgi:hypothetical protein